MKENRVITILLPLGILIASLFIAGYIDHRYAVIKHEYLLVQGTLSSTALSKEEDISYRVTFQDGVFPEKYLYVPDKLDEIAQNVLKGESEQVSVTCRVYTTKRDTKWVPTKTIYQIVGMMLPEDVSIQTEHLDEVMEESEIINSE